MSLPIETPVEPMLAKAVKSVPTGDYVYEPKWDGFRAIVARDGDAVEIGSRGGKPLTRYFPELVEEFRAQLPERCVVDGEIVLRQGSRLDWEALAQRIHPAASRVRLLASETPASFVAFDLLAEGDDALDALPFGERRAALERLASSWRAPLHVTRTTTDAALAERWLAEFEGAGLDGVVAKPSGGSYEPGKRAMLKIKHERTADVVAIGYRIHKSGEGVGSLLLGLYGDDGQLHGVGGVSAFTNARRLELVDELDDVVERDAEGEIVRGAGEKNRFNSAKDTSFVTLRPEHVLEVRYDQLEGARFRHTAQFVRWRPDRDATSCTFDQLEVPAAYDLDDVLGTPPVVE